jgi:hypothetical protein
MSSRKKILDHKVQEAYNALVLIHAHGMDAVHERLSLGTNSRCKSKPSEKLESLRKAPMHVSRKQREEGGSG